ncbi:MAG TPA: TIGR00341 family protein [Patescibacteria group bacterium]|nr:TIGR00341 family protein [Patescibacteria group bacterium]
MNFIQMISGRKNMSQGYSFSASKEERDTLCTSIINSSSPRTGFYLLLILSTFIVAVGLINNNMILVIGGMMVAPLLSPVLSISLAITIFNLKVFIRSILVFLISTLATLLVSMFIGLVSVFSIKDIEMLNLMNLFNITTFLIPIAAGAAASFTWAKKELSSSLTGVAVTVALLPPLVTMGLALAVKNYNIFLDSLNIYFLNVAGIVIGSLIIFLLMGFYKSSKTVVEQVEIESEKSN